LKPGALVRKRDLVDVPDEGGFAVGVAQDVLKLVIYGGKVSKGNLWSDVYPTNCRLLRASPALYVQISSSGLGEAMLWWRAKQIIPQRYPPTILIKSAMKAPRMRPHCEGSVKVEPLTEPLPPGLSV
jgi:hypothetical protein